MKIAVTGASGFVGKHLCEQLRAAGHTLRPIVRSGALMPAGGAVIDSLDERTDWHEALFEVDVVVHTAARVHVLQETQQEPLEVFRKVNVRACENLARQAAKAGVTRLVFLSSIGVLGSHQQRAFAEGDTPNPEDFYSQSKLEAEQALLKIGESKGLEVVIIRPPLVYGPEVKANFLQLMQAVYDNRLIPVRFVRNQRDYVSVGNLGSLVKLVVAHKAAAGEVFHVSDGEAISTAQLVCHMADIMDEKPRLGWVPHGVLALAMRLLGKQRMYESVCGNRCISIAKANARLGWEPEETMQQALAPTVDWFLQQQKMKDSKHE